MAGFSVAARLSLEAADLRNKFKEPRFQVLSICMNVQESKDKFYTVQVPILQTILPNFCTEDKQ